MLPSVQLYSVRDAFADDPLAALERLRAMGFERVEPFGLIENAAALRTGLKQTGLEAPSTHASLLGAEDPAAVLAIARELGIETVIDPYFDRDSWTTVEGIRSVAQKLNDLAPLAAEHGVRIGYHNHEFECLEVDGRTGLEVLSETLDPSVILELDTYWAAFAGADPAELLGRLGERVRLLHLKDGPIVEDDREQLPLGEGAMDIPSILAAAPWVELGVIEFDDYAKDVFDGVEQSLDYLKQIRVDGGEDAEGGR